MTQKRKSLTEESEIDWAFEMNQMLEKVLSYFVYKLKNREEAEDLTSTVMEKVWKKKKYYHPSKGSLSCWIMAIARNTGKDFFRKKKHTFSDRDPDTLSIETASYDEKLIQQIALKDLLSQLKSKDRELIALRYGAEMTHKEIAELLSLSESNVGTRLHRIVSQLKNEWREQYER